MPNGVTGDGIWNRDAYVNEALTFDPALAHQQNTGIYHYHANPIATRHLLGDHVDFNTATKQYSESATAVTKHSPIVGWARDGFPVYGPYGYSAPMDATSGVRRMVCGYVPRNGQNGTTNVAATGRTTLPAWAVRVQNRSATLTSTQFGPAVSATFPLGRYTEDNDYLGDLGKTQGVDFDLDAHNGRFGVTPEFPNGTYAYFVAISAGGTPLYPYNLGRQYYGTPTGGAVTSITETLMTHFNVGPNTREVMSPPAVNGADVALKWSSVEGATYALEGTNDLTAGFGTVIPAITAAPGVETAYTEVGGKTGRTQRFYRIGRTALANYDPVASTTTGGGSGILSVSPTSAALGATFTLTINLDPAVNPRRKRLR
jgi:hypothetical protein